jgi:RimJ/RimL family protein N-acetyltransferase
VIRPLRLETRRLVLRPLSASDEAVFHAINTDPDVRRFLFDNVVLTPADSAAMLSSSVELFTREGLGLFGITQRDDPVLVGWAGYLRPRPASPLEIGYALVRSLWGRGITVEACRAAMVWGAEHARLEKFHASTDVWNIASIRVLEKLGFAETERAGALIFFARDARRLDRADVVCVAAE